MSQRLRDGSRQFWWFRHLAVFGSLCMVGLICAETGVTATTIKIGQSAALTGLSAALGVEMRSGISAYFNSVNSTGGINGRKLELITLDDGYEPAQTASNTKQLIEVDRVFALLGYVGTPTSNAALPIFSAAQVPFIAPLTGASSLRAHFHRQIFNIRASYVDEGKRIVDTMRMFGEDKVAIFYQADAYGEAVRDATVAALGQIKAKPIALATVPRNSLEVKVAPMASILEKGV